MNDEKIHRHLIAESVFKTGNPWLDDAFAGGLDMENLLLVAAKTGVGKTFFGVQLAQFAAKQHKNVHYFALEAERHEIERRMLYYELIRMAKTYYPEFKMPRYKEWIHNGLNEDWESLEKEAEKKIKLETNSLTVRYSQRVFTPDMFRDEVSQLAQATNKPDLIILDHLHHLFLMGEEGDALKTAIHGIKAVKDEIGVPIVVLAQLRKNDAGQVGKRTMPKLEDIRGTAALTDVSTDVIIISPVPTEARREIPASIKFPMYFHIAKSRTAPEAKDFVAIVGFDASTGSYSEKYILAKADLFEDPKLLNEEDKPEWAKSAIRQMQKSYEPKIVRRPYGEKDE